MVPRRTLLLQALVFSALTALDASAHAAPNGQYPTDRKTIDDWMAQWYKKTKEVGAPLKVGRFGDSIYYLTDSISWKPSGNQITEYEAVVVPRGFVTDFASIPRAFWQFLPRDGDYVYGAIIHDYLYWFQPTTREKSDNIFQFIMEEFGISATTIATIFQALRLFGEGAWNENTKLKGNGEKRILVRFPDRAPTTWAKWKLDPNNFQR